MKLSSSKLRLKWLTGMVVFAALASGVWGTTVVPPDFEQLVGRSDYIVRAIVKSVTSEMRVEGQNRHIITRVELEVREVVSGTPPLPLVLEMLGGRVGAEEMVVEGSPQFSVGDDDLLFVHGNGQQFNPLVALMYGRYPIKRDGTTGREFVTRSNGVALYSEQDVALPMSDPSAAQLALKTKASPLSPAAFVSRIRAVARNLQHTRN